jgi:hypothetical protein
MNGAIDAASSSEPSGQNIPKNHCRTTIAERMMETLAELPFIGDQVVCLSHDQAAPSGTRQSFDARTALECSGDVGRSWVRR